MGIYAIGIHKPTAHPTSRPATAVRIFRPMTSPTESLDVLDGLVRLSRRIGQDPRLVQPGGGNTSVKVNGRLLVKGSGTDLGTIGPEGFTSLDLARLAALREADAMSDAEMMRFMAGCMLAEGPAPSVETPLHALLPHRVIAHTHDVATMSLTNVGEGGAVRRRHRVRAVRAPGRSPGAGCRTSGPADPGSCTRTGARASRSGGLG